MRELFSISGYSLGEFIKGATLRLTGKETFSDSLSALGVKRALEVGIGTCSSSSGMETMKLLAGLKNTSGKFHFDANDLWACDPAIASEELLTTRFFYPIGNLVHRFHRERIWAEELGKKVKEGEVSPFDLVNSHGVVSFGHLFPLEKRPFEKALEIMRGKVECLDPNNPESFLVAGTLNPTSCLLLPPDSLEQLGLKPVACQRPDPRDNDVYDLLSRMPEFKNGGLFTKVLLMRK